MWILRDAWDNGGLGFHNACDFTRVEKPLLHTSVIDMREVIQLTCETDVELVAVDVRGRMGVPHGRGIFMTSACCLSGPSMTAVLTLPSLPFPDCLQVQWPTCT